MHASESFRLGLTGLLSNKMRAALTMLGIVFGVASVISMMSIGEGARRETMQQIELLGTNNIIINKQSMLSEDGKPQKYSPGLTTKDAKSIMEINPLLSGITPLRQSELNVQYKSEITPMNIIGTTPDYPATFNSKVVEGTFFNNNNMENYENVCVLGSGIRNKLFRFENPLKEKIKIGDQWFKIIGVVAPKAITQEGMKSFGLRDFNLDIYIPLTSMTGKIEKIEVNTQAIVRRGNRRGFNNNNNDDDIKVVDKQSVDQLTAKVKNGADLRAAASLIERVLDRRHYGVKDYQMILPEQLLEQKQKTQRIFNVVMGAIAGISLLVGGIGIMNIMLANILERTREIGIRRAVGATKIDILSQFLFEAVTISVIGGLIGILIGFLLTRAISEYAEWKTVISPVAVIVSFFISAATGVVFGIYPAKKAADKNPIESLRYE